MPQWRLSQLDSGRQIEIALAGHSIAGRVHRNRAVPFFLEPGNPGDFSLTAQGWSDGDHRQIGRDRSA